MYTQHTQHTPHNSENTHHTHNPHRLGSGQAARTYLEQQASWLTRASGLVTPGASSLVTPAGVTSYTPGDGGGGVTGLRQLEADLERIVPREILGELYFLTKEQVCVLSVCQFCNMHSLFRFCPETCARSLQCNAASRC